LQLNDDGHGFDVLELYQHLALEAADPVALPWKALPVYPLRPFLESPDGRHQQTHWDVDDVQRLGSK
jgi:hypothetical protein